LATSPTCRGGRFCPRQQPGFQLVIVLSGHADVDLGLPRSAPPVVRALADSLAISCLHEFLAEAAGGLDPRDRLPSAIARASAYVDRGISLLRQTGLTVSEIACADGAAVRGVESGFTARSDRGR
jgi:hypothetical protein